jgi:arabinofuranosyltransferase
MKTKRKERQSLAQRLKTTFQTQRARIGMRTLGVVAIAGGTYAAYSLRWLCDDAFITFRYADNYLSGLGFVFNAGEHVEGYSHFLWLCIITFFQWIGVSPELSTVWIGLLAYLSTLALTLFISSKFSESASFTIPFVTIALALHYDFRIWATSGLETSLFTFLVLLGVVVACYIEVRTSIRFFFSGLIFVLVALTRPDGIVFWGVSGAFLVCLELANGRHFRSLARSVMNYAAPFLVLYVPFTMWKIWYYGDIYPNTYYAKSAGFSYFSQGFFYIWTFLRGYASTWLLLLVIPYLVSRWRKSSGTVIREKFQDWLSNPNVRGAILASGLMLIYGLAFIARVGGDFMYARFLHPLIPLAYLVIGISAVELLGTRKTILNIFLAGALLILVDDKTRRDDYLTDQGAYGAGALNAMQGIADERWYWTHDIGDGTSIYEVQCVLGKQLMPIFDGIDATVLLRGQNNFAYYARFRTCIENAGLTDSYIAHLPLQQRGKPGHEKTAPWQYLVNRHTNFLLFRRGEMDTTAFRKVNFIYRADTIWGYMITYDGKMLRELEKRLPGGVDYTHFDKYLDSYIDKMKTKTLAEVRADFKTFEEYYFRWNNDEKRRSAFLEYLRRGANSPGSD